MSNENKPAELMPCPLPDCGAEVQAAHVGPVTCTECRYQAPCVEVHDRFTRLAEIGALVERVIGCQCDIDVQLFIGGSGRLVGLEEAQRLSNKMLKVVRAMLNFETNDTKLIQIVLAGQL